MSGQPEQPSKDWTFTSVYALGFLTLVSTLNYFDRSVLSLLVQPIKKEFGASDTTIGLITSLIASYALFGVPVAWLAERWSRRNVIGIGLAFWSAMTALTGFVGSIGQLGMTRFLMAAGESCGLAPSQSLLSDLFSARRRPVAMSILTTASSLALLAYSPIAVWIEHRWGWRAVFVAAGAPGMVLAILMFLTLREPPRERVRTTAASVAAPIGQVLRFLAGSRTYLLCLLGTTLMGVYLYGVSAWDTALLMRVRHLSLGEVGAYFQPTRGLVGAVGIVLGGVLSSRMERLDERWRCWIPGLSCLILAPCQLIYLFGGPMPLWVSAYVAAALFAIMHQGPIYAVYVGVAKTRMRAVSVSVALLGATVMGQFGGPILIGWLNDTLHDRFGDMAIRYSMLVVMGCAFLSGLCYLAAGRYVRQDTLRAAEG
jgi:MFS family permease